MGGSRVALVVVELQVGVVGPSAMFPQLAAAVRDAGVLERAAELCAAARRAGVLVVHCTAEDVPGVARMPATRIGRLSARLVAARGASPIEVGSPGAAPCPELDPRPEDVVVARRDGLTAFADGRLDAVLQASGVGTVVVCGVSLNVGIAGAVLGAVDRGYSVVVARDAVAGVPAEVGPVILDHALSMVADVRSVVEITSSWI